MPAGQGRGAFRVGLKRLFTERPLVHHGREPEVLADRRCKGRRGKVAASAWRTQISIEGGEGWIGLTVVQVLHAAAKHLAKHVDRPALRRQLGASPLKRRLVVTPSADVEVVPIGWVELEDQPFVG